MSDLPNGLPADLVAIATTDCEGGSCPTIWHSPASGDYYVQGYLPDGTETLVRIPATDWLQLQSQLPPL